MVEYIQIYTRKKEIIEAWKKAVEKYALTDELLKQLVWDIVLELAHNEEFYKKYIEEMKRRINRGEVVTPKRLILDLLFNKQ